MSKELLEALKKDGLPAVFAQGVKLAREGTVVAERQNDREAVLRVQSARQATYVTVTLYFDELEWTCDCPGPADPCAHVVAAALAVQRAAERGEPVPLAADNAAQLLYVFRRLAYGNVTVDRYVVIGDEKIQLESTLARAQSRYPLHPGPGDVVADRIITAAPRGLLRPAIWPSLLAALAEARVDLDGKRMKLTAEPILPEARVLDEGADVVLRIDRSPRVDEVVTEGLARCGDTLCPLGLTDVTGLKMENLPLTRRFSRAELGELSTQVLPSIEKRLPVSVESKRLPRREKRLMPPRLAFEIDNEAHALSVLPTLVYGDPPQARVDVDGELVHMQGDAPVRDLPAERRLALRLRDELNLVLGRRVDFDGQEANRFAAKLRDFQRSIGGEAESELVRATVLEPHVAIHDDVLDLEFRLTEPDGTAAGDGKSTETRRGATAEAALRAWQDGLSLVPLEGGGWAPLPADWLAKFGHRIADLLAARDAEGRISRVSIPALASLADELEQPRPPAFAELEPLFGEFESVP